MVQQANRDLGTLRADQQKRYELLLRRATEGGHPPEKLRHFFRKLFSRRIRNSIRKRLTYTRRCFNDEASHL
jgi:hypothetical protein